MDSDANAPLSSRTTAGNQGAQYELLGRLAVGGMAELFLARTTGADGRDHVVVLKRILPHLAEDIEFVRMFRDEANLAATLNHPNIVRVYDIGREGDDYFFTMEYVHGENLRAILKTLQKSRNKFPLRHVLTIAIGLTSALHYAHEQVDHNGNPLRIVHRDVSPTNVLVAQDGSVKLVDFGIAKAAAATHITQAGMLKGKASYMSPEQCRADPVDRRSDVFAVGILLYEMTTLTRLFKGDNELAILHQVLTGEFPRPSSKVPGFPNDLETIILRCLQTDPAARYQSALELQQDLERYGASHGLHPSAPALGQFLNGLFGHKPLPWAGLNPNNEAPQPRATEQQAAENGRAAGSSAPGTAEVSPTTPDGNRGPVAKRRPTSGASTAATPPSPPPLAHRPAASAKPPRGASIGPRRGVPTTARPPKIPNIKAPNVNKPPKPPNVSGPPPRFDGAIPQLGTSPDAVKTQVADPDEAARALAEARRQFAATTGSVPPKPPPGPAPPNIAPPPAFNAPPPQLNASAADVHTEVSDPTSLPVDGQPPPSRVDRTQYLAPLATAEPTSSDALSTAELPQDQLVPGGGGPAASGRTQFVDPGPPRPPAAFRPPGAPPPAVAPSSPHNAPPAAPARPERTEFLPTGMVPPPPGRPATLEPGAPRARMPKPDTAITGKTVFVPPGGGPPVPVDSAKPGPTQWAGGAAATPGSRPDSGVAKTQFAPALTPPGPEKTQFVEHPPSGVERTQFAPPLDARGRTQFAQSPPSGVDKTQFAPPLARPEPSQRLAKTQFVEPLSPGLPTTVERTDVVSPLTPADVAAGKANNPSLGGGPGGTMILEPGDGQALLSQAEALHAGVPMPTSSAAPPAPATPAAAQPGVPPPGSYPPPGVQQVAMPAPILPGTGPESTHPPSPASQPPGVAPHHAAQSGYGVAPHLGAASEATPRKGKAGLIMLLVAIPVFAGAAYGGWWYLQNSGTVLDAQEAGPDAPDQASTPQADPPAAGSQNEGLAAPEADVSAAEPEATPAARINQDAGATGSATPVEAEAGVAAQAGASGETGSNAEGTDPEQGAGAAQADPPEQADAPPEAAGDPDSNSPSNADSANARTAEPPVKEPTEKTAAKKRRKKSSRRRSRSRKQDGKSDKSKTSRSPFPGFTPGQHIPP